MTKVLAVLVIAGSAGCGPDFTGKYRGSLTDLSTCSDGSGSSTTSPVEWIITEKSGALNMLFGGTCDPVTAKVAGNIATVDRQVCPFESSGGISSQETIERGALTLKAPDLMVDLDASVIISNSTGTGTCTERVTGALLME